MELHLDQCARASKDTGTEGSETTSARTRLGCAGLATLDLRPQRDQSLHVGLTLSPPGPGPQRQTERPNLSAQ